MATETRSPLTRLECPNCGSPIDQYNATSQALVCPACGSHVTVGMETAELLSPGKRLPRPPRPIQIGDRVTIAQVEYMVLGRVLYRGVHEGEAFTWNEWQLGGSDGQMLWLSLDEKGFAFFRKIRFRSQFNPQQDTRLDLGEKKVFIHERYFAQIVGAEGELTWRAKPGERVFVAEGAGNGLKYSIQQTAEELEVHEGRPLGEVALAKAFKNEAWIKKIESLEQWKSTYQFAAIACVIAAIIGLVAAGFSGTTGETLDSIPVELSDDRTSASVNVEFENKRPVIVAVQMVRGSLPANSFVDIDVNIISPDGLSQPLFVQELWHETGYDEDGAWTETQYRTSEMFVPTQAGAHKLELAYDGSVVDDLFLEVTIRRDHIMPLWFLIYGVAAFIFAAIFGLMSANQKMSNV